MPKSTTPFQDASASIQAIEPALKRIAAGKRPDLSRDEGHALIDIVLACDEIAREFRRAILTQPAIERLYREKIAEFLTSEE